MKSGGDEGDGLLIHAASWMNAGSREEVEAKQAFGDSDGRQAEGRRQAARREQRARVAARTTPATSPRSDRGGGERAAAW